MCLYINTWVSTILLILFLNSKALGIDEKYVKKYIYIYIYDTTILLSYQVYSFWRKSQFLSHNCTYFETHLVVGTQSSFIVIFDGWSSCFLVTFRLVWSAVRYVYFVLLLDFFTDSAFPYVFWGKILTSFSLSLEILSCWLQAAECPRQRLYCPQSCPPESMWV